MDLLVSKKRNAGGNLEPSGRFNKDGEKCDEVCPGSFQREKCGGLDRANQDGWWNVFSTQGGYPTIEMCSQIVLYNFQMYLVNVWHYQKLALKIMAKE